MNKRNEILDTLKRIAEVKKLFDNEVDLLHRQVEEIVEETKHEE